ncbi:MAG: peptidoglycan D,D-transpeptidase FtsI family protein, partial [Steroidobacteraceae bacterium]
GEYMQRAQRQQQRSMDVAARRGILYDRNGNELAMSVAVDSVFAVPSEIRDPSGAAAQLASILQEDPQEIFTRIESSHAFCWIARKLDADTAARIRALNLKGIYFQKESKRFYPKRELAAQVLGAVGMDDEGLAGIERSYDSRLRGKPGRMIISMDARRRWFGNLERQPEAGDNLVLTLDEKIQYIAERELESAMRSTRAQAGTVLIQNPRTGEVLALANRPTFNPNALGKAEAQALNDRAVSDVYEPGSTFKIVTIAAALEEKLTTPEEVIDCQMGAIDIAGHTLHDHAPYGNITVAHVLADSSDVGAIKLGLRLGDERFDQYIRAFGFGRQTGIELPGETRGIAKPVGRWSKISVGAISMGQEIG